MGGMVGVCLCVINLGSLHCAAHHTTSMDNLNIHYDVLPVPIPVSHANG